MKKLLLIKEAAEILRCGEKTVYRLLDEGQLVGLKVRGSVRVEAEYLGLYIDKQILKFMEDHGEPEYFESNPDN